jgi:alkaline phosphatase
MRRDAGLQYGGRTLTDFAARAILLLLLALAGCTGTPDREGSGAPAPRNVIILFADGAAATQWELGRHASRLLRNRPFAVTDVVFDRGSLGLMFTHPANAIVTDSAAAASAMSTGYKTDNDMAGVTPDGKPVQTLMETAKARGKRIGIVTTAAVYDASPAAFAAHVKSRRSYQSIVDQYLALEPDVLMGGGRGYFLPQSATGGRRSDGTDVVARFAARGYEVVSDPAGLRSAKGPRLLALFAAGDMDFEIDRDPRREPSMAEMAAAAIRILSASSPNGFVLLVENENIDTAGHANDAAALIRDLWAFDEAVQAALDFQRRAPAETLLLVTGDHESGGLSITYAQKDLASLSSNNRFYAGNAHLEKVSRIRMSFGRVARLLGPKPAPEALDRAIASNFPGFTLDADLREAILGQKPLDRNFTFVTQAALGRMVAR